MKVDQPRSVCAWKGVAPTPPKTGSKLGIALSTLGKTPINGLRHTPTDQTNGWYIWCGTEMSDAPDFFAPLHIEHVAKYLPSIIEYLDLPPGYRFLIDGNNFEDVWFDASLLASLTHEVTAQLDEVYSRESSSLDADVAAAQARTLGRSDW